MRHFSNNDFDTAYAVYNSPATLPAASSMTLEGIAALLTTFFRGAVPHNSSLNVIDAITPEVAAFGEGFGQAYRVFHTPASNSPIVPVGTLEYMVALTLSIKEGTGLHNISLTAIDNMTPEALNYVSGAQLVGQAPIAIGEYIHG